MIDPDTREWLEARASQRPATQAHADQTAHDIKTLQERERVNVHYMNQNAGHILDLLRRVEALEKGKTSDDVRERLAALEHEQWAHWTRYMLDTLTLEIGVALHGVLAPADYAKAVQAITDIACINRWTSQITTPYAALSEKEKGSDREWADKALAIIEGT